MTLSEKITQHKNRLGSRLCILAHHYQSDTVVRHADILGDSWNWPDASTDLGPSISFSAECISWPKQRPSWPAPSRRYISPT